MQDSFLTGTVQAEGKAKHLKLAVHGTIGSVGEGRSTESQCTWHGLTYVVQGTRQDINISCPALSSIC